jgi:alpha-N-acetylglucosamine transferase
MGIIRRRKRRGVVLVCVGKDSVGNEMRDLAMLLYNNKYISKWPITIISDIQINGHTQVIKDYNGDWCGRIVKMSINTLSPYDETLFLDVDIIITKPIDDIWNYLDNTDFALSIQNMAPHQYNSGVMLFRKSDAVDNLFKLWRSYWRGKYDQIALRQAIDSCNMRLSILPSIYNYMVQWDSYVKDLIKFAEANKIIHVWNGCARGRVGLIKGYYKCIGQNRVT